MTVITETRWKCDWQPCGTVSPVFSQLWPKGWLEHYERSFEDRYITTTLNNKARVWMGVEYHFCSEAHFHAWLAEHDNEVGA